MLTVVTEAPDAFAAAARGVRASGALGRSQALNALFDYLVAASAEGRSPKESEIAHDVFGKPADFAYERDAVVRVYVHRLRRKLDDHARTRGAEARLTLPRGQYRMVLQPAADAPTRTRHIPRAWLVGAAVAALVAFNLGAWAWQVQRSGALGEAAALRASPVWAPFARSKLPLLLVVGDYFIMGESDDGLEIDRLVREYGINSTEDLDRFLMRSPDKAGRYVDLGLRYLPTSTAAAVSRITGLFGPGKPIRVVIASQVTPQMLKAYDMIYIGYLSGLGPLRYTLFSGSRYAPGDSYDEIVDLSTQRRFISQAALGPVRGDAYRDYGYVAVFSGPVGNHIAMVAGARDIGALAAAEQVTGRAGLRALAPVAAQGRPFEAIFEVEGQGDVNFHTRLVAATRRGSPQAWAAESR